MKKWILKHPYLFYISASLLFTIVIVLIANPFWEMSAREVMRSVFMQWGWSYIFAFVIYELIKKNKGKEENK